MCIRDSRRDDRRSVPNQPDDRHDPVGRQLQMEEIAPRGVVERGDEELLVHLSTPARVGLDDIGVSAGIRVVDLDNCLLYTSRCV